MDAKFKTNDDVFLVTDRKQTLRPKYRVLDHYFASVPSELGTHKGWNVQNISEDESDHNYLIAPESGGTQRTVNENEIER